MIKTLVAGVPAFALAVVMVASPASARTVFIKKHGHHHHHGMMHHHGGKTVIIKHRH